MAETYVPLALVWLGIDDDSCDDDDECGESWDCFSTCLCQD